MYIYIYYIYIYIQRGLKELRGPMPMPSASTGLVGLSSMVTVKCFNIRIVLSFFICFVADYRCRKSARRMPPSQVTSSFRCSYKPYDYQDYTMITWMILNPTIADSLHIINVNLWWLQLQPQGSFPDQCRCCWNHLKSHGSQLPLWIMVLVG